MIGAEEALNLIKESLIVADPGRMIDALQLDVPHVGQVLRQVPAVCRRNQNIVTPVQYKARGVHRRTQAPHLDGGRHADDGIGGRRAGAVALEARYGGLPALGACRGGAKGARNSPLPHTFRMISHAAAGSANTLTTALAALSRAALIRLP